MNWLLASGENRNYRWRRAGNEAGTCTRKTGNHSPVVSVAGKQMNHGSHGAAGKRRKKWEGSRRGVRDVRGGQIPKGFLRDRERHDLV